MNYTFDDKEFQFEQGCLICPEPRPKGHARLADLVEAIGALPAVGPAAGAPCGLQRGFSNAVRFDSDVEFRKWMDTGSVDFAEIFSGMAEATVRVREAGLAVAEGFDRAGITYERCWHLDTEEHQADLAWVLTFVLHPIVIHLGTLVPRCALQGPRK